MGRALGLSPAGVRALEAATGQGIARLVRAFARRTWRATDVCAALGIASGASREDVDRLAGEIGLARAAALVAALLERALAGEGAAAGLTRDEFAALKAKFPDAAREAA